MTIPVICEAGHLRLMRALTIHVAEAFPPLNANSEIHSSLLGDSVLNLVYLGFHFGS